LTGEPGSFERLLSELVGTAAHAIEIDRKLTKTNKLKAMVLQMYLDLEQRLEDTQRNSPDY